MAEAIETTQQIVLSVRAKGDSIGPQTGDVVLGGPTFADFSPLDFYEINEVIVYEGDLYRAKQFVPSGEFDPKLWEPLTQVMVFLRDYKGGQEYEKDQIVLYNEKLWRAKENFVSTEIFDPIHWDGIDAVDVDLQDFEPHSIYDKYEAIIHESKLYRAKDAFTAGATFIESDWELVNDTLIEDFQPNRDYNKNNIIVVSGALYRAKKDFTAGSTFDPSDWESIAAVGFSEFEAGRYYSKNSVISHDNKIYIAKDNFTAGSTFDTNDWTILSDVGVEDFTPDKYYPENHIIFHEGKLYRAKKSFTAETNFNPSDWENLNPSKTEGFVANNSYYEDEMIVYNGAFYSAKNDFVSGDSFDPADWNKIGGASLQNVYETSSDDFANPSLVYPTVGTVFKEEIHAPGSDSRLEAFTDNNGGIEELREGAIIEAGASAKLTAKKTGLNQNTANFSVTDVDAIGKMEVVRDKNDPYINFTLKDNLDEEMSIRVKTGDSAVSLTSGIKKALTDSLNTATNTQLGVIKTDDYTTISDDQGILSSRAIIRDFETNKNYKEHELVRFNNNYYVAKIEFTSGSEFNFDNWHAIKTTASDYASGSNYKKGDLITVTVNGVTKLQYAKKDIASAPATKASADWGNIGISANEVSFDSSSSRIITSNNVQNAISDLDYALGTAVKPLDGTTEFLFTTQAAGSAAPSPVAGKTIISLYTE